LIARSGAFVVSGRYGLRVVAPVTSRRSRGASRATLAPTFVSGRCFLWDLRADVLVHGAISRRTSKAVARACHRRYWPETNWAVWLEGFGACGIAPPARRIASYARSYVCFGPLFPGGFACGRLGAWRDITSYLRGSRARLPQALLARNKRRSERSSRCAARAALDLAGATTLKPRTLQP